MCLLASIWPFLNFVLLCVCVTLLTVIWITVRRRNGKTRAVMHALIHDQEARDDAKDNEPVGVG